MRTQNGKISVRQAIILFVLSTLSAAIRLFPSLSAKMGMEASWLAPVISIPFLLVLCAVLQSCFKKRDVGDLTDVFHLALGKILGSILVIFYLFWILMIYFLYIRYYSERLLSSIFPNTDLRFFIIPMMILVWVAARGRIEAFARFCEISALMFTFIFIIFFLLLIPSIKASNLLPITQTDFVPALLSAYPVLGVWGYITAVFFLGDDIADKEAFRIQSKKGIAYLAVMTTIMMIFVVGSLGSSVSQRMSLPFFNATKLISIISPLDRFEPLLLASWMASDFIVIVFFARVAMSITKKVFSSLEIKYFATPVALMGYAGSQYLSADRFELAHLSESFALPGNLILFYLIPLLVFIVGKLRKKI